MEILLIACMLAYVAGAQSEQSKLGISPADRAVLKEQTRHEKAVQKIADKHGVKPPRSRKAGLSPWKEAPDTDGEPQLVIPDTFMSGYRTHRPTRRPFGHRVGAGAGAGVTWMQDSTRDAWQAYREKRRKVEHDDPKPVMAPVPPTHPPNAPPLPDKPPTVGAVDDPDKTAEVDTDETPTAKPDDAVVAKPTDVKPAEAGTEPEGAKPDEPAEAKPDLTKPKPEEAAKTEPDVSAIEPEPAAPETADTTAPAEKPAANPGGIGRMAAEVTYESVMDESDELSAMCEDDIHVYERIRDRAEREISRGDELIAQLEAAGFGSKVIAWVARCKESYSVIRGEVEDLKANTIAQDEAVVKAKALLLSGQGVYADIAKDMESVADREAYISDAVDAEDTRADTEHYETKAAA